MSRQTGDFVVVCDACVASREIDSMLIPGSVCSHTQLCHQRQTPFGKGKETATLQGTSCIVSGC